MNRSTISLRTTLILLAALVLGSGIGTVLAAATPQRGGGPSGSTTLAAVPSAASPGAELTAIDLTRHTTRLVEGVPGTRGSVSVSCRMGSSSAVASAT